MKTRRVAFYGKGGIGKSTIASNVSALLAMQGKKVLHIGCDPKADSTRLLCKERIKTVLEVLEEKDYPEREDLVYRSESGVWCVESGGPEAGNGCAGMGIITAMKELERIGVLEEDWDVIIYDVLGDVVCGGFSVPMRQGYVDRVYIVSSADFMSLYAANNILKGVVSYSDERNLLGGFVFNHIREQEEDFVMREGIPLKVRTIGISDDYVEHGNVDVLRKEVGLDRESIVKKVIADDRRIKEEK